MKSQIAMALNCFLVIFMCFSCLSQAHRSFYVGGKDGWVTDPAENYIHWAERNRFQVNDSLIFGYKKGFDSVLEVNKDDYYKCNKGKPIQTLTEGESEFKFHRSGPFYFISGYANNCELGQKLIVVVLFPRGGATTEEAPSPVAKATTPPSSHSHSPTPSPSPSPCGNPLASPPPQAKSPFFPPHQVSHHHLAPAPAPSAASVPGGASIGSLLGFSLTVTVVLSSFF